MLGQKTDKFIITTALAALVLFSTSSYGNSAAAQEKLDQFGIEKIYPTAQGGNEWYVNMDDPRSTLDNIRNVEFEKNSDDDGSWHVSARQIRMEAWSPPENEKKKWHNVEITMYAKMDAGTSSSDLLQMYSRGGHHSSKDPCSGSAYKARLYEDGRAAWTKEVTHPAYAKNRGVVQATNEPLEDRWVGFKAVIYNFVENGQTYVRLESYIDDDVTDANGNLVIKNNWKLASVVEDRGGWGTPDGDFADHCGIARDAILAGPGGSGDRNLVAWRSDSIGWSFMYLSAREIDPLGHEQQLPEPQPEQSEEPAQPEPIVPEVEEDPTIDDGNTVEEPTSGDIADLTDYEKVASKQVQSDRNTTIASVEIPVKNLTLRSSGTAIVGIMQDGDVIATSEPFGTRNLDVVQYTNTTAIFDPAVSIDGSYEIAVYYYGSGSILVESIS